MIKKQRELLYLSKAAKAAAWTKGTGETTI